MDIPFVYKYQPIYLKDFELNKNILDLIKTLITMDNLNIILTGDSGCGKTSLILAIVKEYYGNIDYQNNVLSINSLKEQGIAYYRTEVKTFCQTASLIPDKKKIILLDDLDLINEQSQQVFRNCIDKFSGNVHFISTAVNSQKIIDSLQSRMTIIKIKPLSKDKLVNILEKIIKIENIKLEKEIKEFVLSISGNSVRTMINYLEKFKLLHCEIDENITESVCTNIPFSEFIKYTLFCKNKKIKEAIELLYNIFDRGYSVMDILDNYFIFIKTTELLNEDEKYKIIKLICKYITIFHNIHEDEIELALFTNNFINLF